MSKLVIGRTNPKHACAVPTCRRHNTLLVRWSGERVSMWACWRPWHIRKVWGYIEAREAAQVPGKADTLLEAMRQHGYGRD